MIAGEHFSSRSISTKASELRSSWRRLENKMADRGDKLRQAGQQEQLMELLQVHAVTSPRTSPLLRWRQGGTAQISLTLHFNLSNLLKYLSDVCRTLS